MLDVLRAGAALLVLSGHVRTSVFLPFEDVDSDRTVWAPFYAVTSMGHEAVMVFFALSGYLVGGQVLRRIGDASWSWKEYGIRRLTRLWIVIVPALVATFFFDHVSMAFGYQELYSGKYGLNGDLVPSLPTLSAPAEYGLAVFLGNILFLQTICVPVYGSNGPLWSLACEFWYYTIFPLVAWAILGRNRPLARALALCLALLLVAVLPWRITRLGLVWLSGAISAAAGECLRQKSISVPLWISSVIGLAIGGVMIISVHPVVRLNDLILGAFIATGLPFLAMRPTTAGPVATAIAFGAEISYSLYLFHFPIVVCLAGLVSLPNRLPASAEALAIFGAIFVVALLSSMILWFAFERHTRRVYLSIVSFVWPSGKGALESRAGIVR